MNNVFVLAVIYTKFLQNKPLVHQFDVNSIYKVIGLVQHCVAQIPDALLPATHKGQQRSEYSVQENRAAVKWKIFSEAP